MNYKKLSSIIEINPYRALSKNSIASFVSMDNIVVNQRKIQKYSKRKVSGSKTTFKNGDTLLAKITPSLENGKTVFVDILQKNEIGHGSTEFYVLTGKNNITLNLFVYYIMRMPEFREKAIQSMTGTSGRQRVQKTVFDDFRINLPDISTQNRITRVLNNIDNQIENLQNQNKLLEQMTQTIFKSWFVDFDGITEFEDSELGKIPKGWKIDVLESIVKIIMGQSPPGTSYNKNKFGMIFFQGKTDFGKLFPIPKIYCTSPKKIAEKNDILFTVRAPIGDMNIATERCCIGRGLASLRLKNNHGSFLYFFLKNLHVHWKSFESNGTIFGALTKNDIHNFKTVIPNLKIIKKFNYVADPFYYCMLNNNNTINYLVLIRNTLLPKLMLGEIKV